MLKLFYACFYLTIGVSTPFFPAYLRQLGLSGRQVGVLLAIPPALQLVVPLGWGWLADRTRRPDRVLRALCLGAFLASLPVIFARTMPALFAAYFAQQIFAVAIVGMADSVAVERWRRGAAYGPTRAAGSAAFMTACLVAGWWLDVRGLLPADRLVPTLVSVGLAASFLAALGLRGRAMGERPHARDVRRLFGDRRFRALLVMAGLHWAALVPYHGFFGILLRERGLPARFTSFAFVIGTSAEIVVLFLFRRLRERFGLAQLLAAVFAVSAVRWWLSSFVSSSAVILALQLAHGLTFGLYWVSAMAWLAASVPSAVRATGQMMFTMVNGIGGVTALLITGILYDIGGAGLPFALAGVLDLLALGLVLLAARKGEPATTVTSAAT
jgi:MFS transporter, PPP family, 3-phenylpropionic acid transporter